LILPQDILFLFHEELCYLLSGLIIYLFSLHSFRSLHARTNFLLLPSPH
jgi:hypothetical protein